MKLVSLLSGLAVAGVFSAIAGLVFNTFALAFFSGAIIACLLLLLATDYAPRHAAAWVRVVAGRREVHPLAA